tara:strand:- start:211 stop:3732 length:3522 start_codon:yes stop_codon:yes gene_type:complete
MKKILILIVLIIMIQPVVASLDRVIAGTGGRGATDSVYVFYPNSTRIWNSSPEKDVQDVIAADFDEDGVLENVIAASDKVYAYNESGGLVWSYTAGGDIKSVAAVDIDSSGYLDYIVAGSKDDSVYALNSTGEVVWSYTTGKDINVRVAIAAVDLDSDGYLDDVLVASKDNTVYAFNESGEVVWSYTSTSDMNVVAALDVDADGFFDDAAVAGQDDTVYVFNNDGTNIWNYTTGKDVKDVAAIDLDSDGYLDDVAAVSHDNKVYAFNESGGVVWSYTGTADMKAVAAADFDGDGYLDDVIAGSKDNKVYAFDSEGTKLWDYTTGGDVKTVAAADFDGDGYLGDVVAGSKDDSVYAIYSNGTLAWSLALDGDVREVAVADLTVDSPPATVTNLNNQSQGVTWIYWNWSNPDDADFNHTEVWINGTFYANVSNDNFYNATGLASDTDYEIQTRTVDHTGNINTSWVNDIAKTLVLPDTTPPAAITNLNNQSQGVTWIYWNWTNPIDFWQNIIYLGGINMMNTSDNYYNATDLLSNTYYSMIINTKDTERNINYTNVTNTAKTLENVSVLTVLNVTPANNSVNVSLIQDITVSFNDNVSNLTILVKDGNGDVVRGEIEYLGRTLRFNPYRFWKENESYVVNLTLDLVWSFTTQIKDADNDGIPDSNDNDDDNDGVDDVNDSLKGINASSIKTDIEGLSVKVNDSLNLSRGFDEEELVQFFVNDSMIIEFNFSFGDDVLDLTNVSIEQNENSSVGSMIIKGLGVELTKTFYVDNLSSYEGVCIKDADVDSVSDISDNCTGSSETFVHCPGRAGGYNCSLNGTRWKITGLNHSAVQQDDDNDPPGISLISVSNSWTSVTLTVVTDEDAVCRYDREDVSFAAMGYLMSGSGLQHSKSVSEDSSGTYYVLCEDGFGNDMVSSSSISFVVTRPSSSGGGGGGSGYSRRKEEEVNVLCKERWVCEGWGVCKDGSQTRECHEVNDCGSESEIPKMFQTCENDCEEIWRCNRWSVCSNEVRRRECYDLNGCDTESLKPGEYEECEFVPECYNLIKDGDEEGVDCGGSCLACESCFDRMKNQDEEGIDCGGVCRPCKIGDIIATGKSILVMSDKVNTKSLLLSLVIVVSLILFLVKAHTLKDFVKKRRKKKKSKKKKSKKKPKRIVKKKAKKRKLKKTKKRKVAK